ncbi:MAG: hypothetical protein E7580_00235 [Ruminococcaceae bacterium]|nr:hypothetical protein [Oscillospiraceae bacterium]
MKKKKDKEALKEELLPAEEPVSEESEEETPSSEQLMEEDIDLFRSLFPEVKGEDIPQEVWDRVEQGESLAASYALFAVKKYREEERIGRINEENGKKAPPPIEGGKAEGDYFSPEAVKNMSRSEIRKNYDKILSSMEKWN